MCKTCGCGHDHEHDHEHEEMELETMFLTLEDDTELECGILGVFEVEGMKGKEFIALLPLEETVLLYEDQENGDDVELSVIEDDDDFEKVSNTFYDLFDGEDEE